MIMTVHYRWGLIPTAHSSWRGSAGLKPRPIACRDPRQSEVRRLQHLWPPRSPEIFATFFSVMKMLAGLMSRWIIPFSCAASSPSAI